MNEHEMKVAEADLRVECMVGQVDANQRNVDAWTQRLAQAQRDLGYARAQRDALREESE